MTANKYNVTYSTIAVIIFGLLYIPAFIYGYFWLWVFPFTAIIALFVRAMIDSVIEKVKSVGDEAAQAKAMIPEFIKMNVVMTVLLSIPFVSTLWLNEWGYTERLQYSAMDRSFFEYFLSLFAKDYMLPNMYASIENYVPVQIMVSNLFFMVVASLVLLFSCYKKIKQLFLVLFHKGSYKFLRQASSGYNGSAFRHFVNIGLVMFIIGGSGLFYDGSRDINTIGLFLTFLNFFIFLQVSNVVSGIVEEQVVPLTSDIKGA